MVEELKLAIKIDDDVIEQLLLKQFNNAEKMADKVVLTFKNVNLDDKNIEAKFKEMQKMAGKNPIDLSINDKSVEMLSAISKQLSNIFEIAKGKSLIDSSSTVSEANKIKQKVKASSIFKDLIDVSGIKNGSDELNSALASSMKNLKMLYDSGKTESLEYYATLYKIIEIQKKMWQFNDMGKKSSYDSSPNVKDATERMRVQDSILADFKQYADVASDTVDFVINEFSRLKNAGEGIFGENGKLISKSTLTNSMDLLFDETYIEGLKQQEQQALATADAEQKLANVEQQSSKSSFTENQDKIQQELKETEQIAEQTAEALEKVNSNGNKSNISSGNSTIKDVFQNENTSASSTAITEESQALDKVSTSATEASIAKEKFANANKEVKASAVSSSEAIKEESLKLKAVDNSIAKYQASLDKLSINPKEGNRFPEYASNIDQLKAKLEELKTLRENIAVGENGLINAEYTERLKLLTNQIENLITTAKNTPQAFRGWKDINASNVAEKIYSILEKNTNMSTKAKKAIMAYYNEIVSGNPSKPLNEILNECIQIEQAERDAGRAGKSWLDICFYLPHKHYTISLWRL